MNFKRLIALMMALCLAVCLCACGAKVEEKKDASNPTQTTADAGASESTEDTKGNEDTQPSQPAQVETKPVEPEDDGKVIYVVKVVDEGGNPVANAGVQLCKESCLPAFTGEDGTAEFRVVEDPEYKVSFMEPFPMGFTGIEEAYYFEAGTYELTITLKAVA